MHLNPAVNDFFVNSVVGLLWFIVVQFLLFVPLFMKVFLFSLILLCNTSCPLYFCNHLVSLVVSWAGLQCATIVFPGHTQYCFKMLYWLVPIIPSIWTSNCIHNERLQSSLLPFQNSRTLHPPVDVAIQQELTHKHVLRPANNIQIDISPLFMTCSIGITRVTRV